MATTPSFSACLRLASTCTAASPRPAHPKLSVIEPDLAEQAEAVIIEAISNAVRHAEATSLIVDVSVADELTINISDNGCGMPAENQRRSGLANMTHRAEQFGGTCRISTPVGGGTHICWTAPLASQ